MALNNLKTLCEFYSVGHKMKIHWTWLKKKWAL